MIVILIVIAVLLVATVFACLKVSGDCSRQEEEHPCQSCVRWEECNGVDEQCPRRGNDAETQ